MTTEEQLAKAERERDSFKRQLATLQDAIVLALVQRIEPRMSRHPVTVVQYAGSIIARIGEAMACQFEDGDDLVEAAKELVRERDEARGEIEVLRASIDGEPWGAAVLKRERDEARERANTLATNCESYFQDFCRVRKERDEARAEVERLRAEAAPMNEHFTAGYRDGARDAYHRGAEAMRDAAANALHMAGHGTLCDTSECEHWGRYVRALPIPEEP